MAKNYNSYSYTLTSSEGFTPEQVLRFRDWFKVNTSSCLLVSELHLSGKVHLHAGATSFDTSARNIVKRLVRIYDDELIPIQKNISIKVKKTTDQIGWFHYLTKDLEGEPVLCKGWKLTWIQEQVKANLKKMPHKMVKGTDYPMTMVTAPNLVIQYAKRICIPLTGKDSFAEVLSRMMEDGYQIHNLKIKILYAEIMAKCGRRSVARDMILNELNWL